VDFGYARFYPENSSHVVAMQFAVLLPPRMKDTLCLGGMRLCLLYPFSREAEVREVVQRRSDVGQVSVWIGLGELAIVSVGSRTGAVFCRFSLSVALRFL
jgi:hypothetical protein